MLNCIHYRCLVCALRKLGTITGEEQGAIWSNLWIERITDSGFKIDFGEREEGELSVRKWFE